MSECVCACVRACVRARARVSVLCRAARDRETDRQKERDRQRDRATDRDRDWDRERERESETDRQTSNRQSEKDRSDVQILRIGQRHRVCHLSLSLSFHHLHLLPHTTAGKTYDPQEHPAPYLPADDCTRGRNPSCPV